MGPIRATFGAKETSRSRPRFIRKGLVRPFIGVGLGCVRTGLGVAVEASGVAGARRLFVSDTRRSHIVILRAGGGANPGRAGSRVVQPSLLQARTTSSFLQARRPGTGVLNRSRARPQVTRSDSVGPDRLRALPQVLRSSSIRTFPVAGASRPCRSSQDHLGEAHLRRGRAATPMDKVGGSRLRRRSHRKASMAGSSRPHRRGRRQDTMAASRPIRDDRSHPLRRGRRRDTNTRGTPQVDRHPRWCRTSRTSAGSTRTAKFLRRRR